MRSSVDVYYDCDRENVSSGTLYCLWMVLVFGNISASNRDCSGRETGDGRSVLVHTSHRNFYCHRVGVATAYGQVVLPKQSSVCFRCNIIPRFDGVVLVPSEVLGEQRKAIQACY